MQRQHSKNSSNVALYCLFPAPLPIDAEFRNKLLWLRSQENSAERDLKASKNLTLSQNKNK